MDTIYWPTLTRRLQGRAIVDLWYDPTAGLLVILLEGGRSVLVSADWEGCQIVVSDLCRLGGSTTRNRRLECNGRA